MAAEHANQAWTSQPSDKRGSLARGFLDPSVDSAGGAGRSKQRGAPELPPTYAVWQANREIRRHSIDARSQENHDSLAAQLQPGESPSYCERNLAAMRSILEHPFSLLLIAFPLGIVSSVRGWDAQLTFWLNFAALVPLAKILGDATEELDACLHNEVISGLLNATFGNAVEMIITIQTLRVGLVEVVKATLLGSVLSNMLLVLGMSFFFGGIMEIGGSAKGNSNSKPGFETPLDVSFTESMRQRVPLLQASKQEVEEAPSSMRLVMEKEQTFIVNSAMVSVTMLLVSCLSFALPTVFTQGLGDPETVLSISRTAAVITGTSYLAYLVFQLITHRNMLGNEEEGGDDDDDDDEDVGLTLGWSLGLLAATTVLVSISSELLVNVIEDVVEKSHISECFIGIILLPIVGNACEHAAAVRFAVQNKPGLSISIAIGSSVQIALFVVPFSVMMGWYIGQPMTLDFGVLNTTVLFICVLVVLSIVVDGRSNWLEGYMLCSAYALISVMYWHVNSFGDHIYGPKPLEL